MPPKTSGRGLAALYGKTIPKIKTSLLSERLNIIRQGSVDTFQARMEAVASLGKMTRKGAKEYRQYQEAKEFGDFEGGYFDYLKSPLEAQAARETAVSAIKEKRLLEKQEQEAMTVRDIRDKEQDALDAQERAAMKQEQDALDAQERAAMKQARAGEPLPGLGLSEQYKIRGKGDEWTESRVPLPKGHLFAEHSGKPLTTEELTPANVAYLEQKRADEKTAFLGQEYADQLKFKRDAITSGEDYYMTEDSPSYITNEGAIDILRKQDMGLRKRLLKQRRLKAQQQYGEQLLGSTRQKQLYSGIDDDSEVEMAEDAKLDYPLNEYEAEIIHGPPPEQYAVGEATKIRDPRTGAWTESIVPETPYPYGRRIESGRGLSGVIGGGQPSMRTSYQAENLQNFNRPYSLEKDPGYLPLREKILKQNELDRYEEERLREQSLFKRWQNPSQYGLGGSFEA